MSIEIVKSVIKEFLTDTRPRVLSIKGHWGVGKTYAWKKILTEQKLSVTPKKYSYVSLFGIKSVNELRTTIFAKTELSKLVGEKLTASTINREWKSLGQSLTKKALLNGRNLIGDIPYANKVSVGFELVANHMIKDTLVCLDDFERLNESDGIKQADVLGVISSLKEEKNCKIVLMFNEDKLEGETYKSYREKVVDLELLYDPTAHEAFDIGVPIETPWREEIKLRCSTLQIKNIRVLKKIVENIIAIEKISRAAAEKTKLEIVSAVVLLTWVVYDTAESTPSLDFIRAYNSWAPPEGPENSKQKAWATTLSSYGWSHADELYYSILSFIENGYLQGSKIEDRLQAKKEEQRAAENESLMEKAWDLYRNSFGDNESAVVEAMFHAVSQNAKTISPMNLYSAVKVLRDLEHNDKAERLIDLYIENRKGDAEAFNMDKYPWSSDIDDQSLLNKFKNALSQEYSAVDLGTAIRRVAIQQSWNIEDEISISSATEDDFYKLFTETSGRDLLRIAGYSQKLSGLGGRFGNASARAAGALKRIATLSKIDRLRIKRLGVEID